MAHVPEKHFELSCVDPPYGIGESGGVFRDRKGGGHRVLEKKHWDKESPNVDYFNELKRVSINQIIWGSNHFASKINQDSSGWIYWNKLMGGDFSDGELAYTSFNRALKSFTFCNKYAGKIHPTEKPTALYEWLLTNYAKQGDKILDTHGGSMSSVIAALNLGYEIVCSELDVDYYNAGVKRVEQSQKQERLFK